MGSYIRRISTDEQLPVPLPDLRLDLRVDDDDDDATLERMERTAAALIEVRSGKVIMPGLFEALFNACDRFVIHRAPLRQVTAIAFLTGRDEWTEGDVADFRVLQSENHFLVRPYPGFHAPQLLTPEQSVRIQFTAGYDSVPGSGDSPQSSDPIAGPLPDLYRGILIALTGHFYENRELFLADKLTEIESTAGGLLNSIRQFW